MTRVSADPMHDLLLKRPEGGAAMIDADPHPKASNLHRPSSPDPLCRRAQLDRIQIIASREAATYDRCVQAKRQYKSRYHLQTGGACIHNARLKLHWQPAKGSRPWAKSDWALPWALKATSKLRSQEKPCRVGSHWHMAGPGCRAHFVHDRTIILERCLMISRLSDCLQALQAAA